MKYFILTVVCILAAAHLVYKYTGYSVYDLLPPKEVAVHALTAKEMASFGQPIAIPDKVLENSSRVSNAWTKTLYADKKTVLFVNWEHRYTDLMSDFKNLFRSKGYNQFYRQQFFILSSFQTFGYDSLEAFILTDHPKRAICIVNPKTKEIVVLPKADISYLAAFLEKYKDW